MKSDMMCAECGGKMKRQIVTHHYLESGLDNVYLEKVSAYKCQDCAERFVLVPSPVQLHIVMAISLSFKRELLVGPEIKFMRKEIGMNGKSFAKRIGVAPETLSKWENAEGEQTLSHDKLIRLAFREMMCERVHTIISWMEERIQKAKIISITKSRVDIDTERLKLIAFPELERGQGQCFKPLG